MILSLLFACATPEGTGGPDNRTPDETFDSEVVELGCEGDIGLEAGMCAPDFSLISANGGQTVLSELASERVVVIGAATW
ncbi:MAG: hypothetical protein GY913_23350 [Proteobacteria bacterium]|nr:hypothetical protein [Pseudomonadota bacterium]MCP4919849.1 hypothetical protein [Pseudomonadota bacterium]